MHFFAILESFKFPFFARALSLMWFHLAHDIAFNMCGSFIFERFQLQKEKRRLVNRVWKFKISLIWNHFKKQIPFSLSLPKKITIFALKYTFKFILADFWMWDSLALISNTVITPPFHWNWNGCWCFHKRENAFPCWKIKSLLLNFRWWKKSN